MKKIELFRPIFTFSLAPNAAGYPQQAGLLLGIKYRDLTGKRAGVK